ncbi:MAG: phenylalanine--tRNA ligase subunit alpha [Candidatus Bathyarchaeia archaeon]
MPRNEGLLLSTLGRLGGRSELSQLSKITGLPDAAVSRASLELSRRGFLRIIDSTMNLLKPTEEGMAYAKDKLPERKLVELALRLGRPPVKRLASLLGFDEGKLSIAIGWVKRKGWGEVVKEGGELLLEVKGMPEEGADERLLREIGERGWAILEGLDEEGRRAAALLRGRNLLEAIPRSRKEFELTGEGWAAVEEGLEIESGITTLTPELIRSGKWREADLKEYDVTASPPEIHPGKKHVFMEFLEEAKRILLEMGFEEYSGPYVETEFWNFDVLFQPQDHPSREIHDSYILKSPGSGWIEFPDLMEKVRRVHEDGWITGSRGWRYRWDRAVSERLVLRTQTTAVSVRYLSTHKEPPIKMFCISNVFRPDVLDAKHSMEFVQLDGIIGDEGINLRHLLGFLREFSRAIGLGEVKFKPSYFPFTEPSVESFAEHPKIGWIEFAGAGMFRPEVLAPLGIGFPVIAWGIGLDRLAMIKLGIDDIRELRSTRLDWLREKPLI